MRPEKSPTRESRRRNEGRLLCFSHKTRRAPESICHAVCIILYNRLGLGRQSRTLELGQVSPVEHPAREELGVGDQRLGPSRRGRTKDSDGNGLVSSWSVATVKIDLTQVSLRPFYLHTVADFDQTCFCSLDCKSSTSFPDKRTVQWPSDHQPSYCRLGRFGLPLSSVSSRKSHSLGGGNSGCSSELLHPE